MTKPRIYDQHGQLQCVGACQMFLPPWMYYGRSARVCKTCLRDGAAATRSRAKAKHKYHSDEAYRQARSEASILYNRVHTERTKCMRRAKLIGQFYAMLLNMGGGKTSYQSEP